MKKIDLLILLFLAVSSLFTLKDLFIPGFYTSHDGPHQIVRAFYYHQALFQGQIPPRWVQGLNFGFGYPLFIFSYHFPWLLAEIFRLFGLGVIDSVKMTFLTGFMLSGIFMYLYQLKIFGRLPAFVGTLIYLFAPFRFSNIFVRASIGDATAFIFAPLVFWSFDLLRKKISLTPALLLGLSLAGLLISHAMVFFLYILALSLYAGYRLAFHRKKLKLVLYLFFCLLVFIGLSSFYLIPSVMERTFTKFPQIMGSASSNLNFVPFSKLIYSPWGYGTVDAYQGSMSLSVGIAQWAVFLLAAFTVLFQLYRPEYRRRLIQGYGLIFLAVFILSIVLMMPASTPFWKFVSRFVIIDFNWRSLNLTVFSSSVLAGWLISGLKNNKFIFISAGMLLLILAFYTNRNHLKINQSLDWTVPFFLKLEKTTNSYDEYMPKWVNNEIIKENSPRLTFTQNYTHNIEFENSYGLNLSIRAENDGLLSINTLYYPGWQVFDNGIKREIDPGEGIIKLPLNKGVHTVSARFGKTPLRNFADMTSLTSLILTVTYLIMKKLKSDKNA